MDKLLILNVITIIALSCANCKGTLPIQLFKVFNRIQNCDVQIVYGDLESANIQPFPNLLVLTSLIFASNFPRKRNWWDPEDWNRFAIDISRTRVPPCQLAILFSSKFLKYESKREFQKWTRFGTDRHFRFGKSGEHFENWSTSIKNTYVILVTDYEKKELAKVFLGNYFVVGFIENAGIVFNHGIDNLFEFCVLRSGEPTKMTSFNCETNIKSNFLEQFNKLQTKLQNWELSTFDNTDINLPKEGGIVELIRVPEFINPFDRSDINSSIHQHVAQSIFRKSNSTLSYCRHDYLGALTYSGQIKLGNIEGRAWLPNQGQDCHWIHKLPIFILLLRKGNYFQLLHCPIPAGSLVWNIVVWGDRIHWNSSHRPLYYQSTRRISSMARTFSRNI